MSEQPVGEWPDVPARSGVEVVLGAADRVTGAVAACSEIRELTQRRDGKPRYLLRRADVLAILDKHGVA